MLAVASQFTIKSIEDLIEITGLSEASVGFAILSVMTSIPEIFVAVSSLVHGKVGFSVGDILGSNVFNIGIVVGVLAVLGALKKCSTSLLTELVDILFLSSIIPLILVISGAAHSLVGAALLGIFVFSIYKMTRKPKQPSIEQVKNNVTKNPMGNKKIIFLKIIGGIAIIIASAELIILSASNISIMLGIAPILIVQKLLQ